MQRSRRQILAGGAVIFAAGCTGQSTDPDTRSRTETSSTRPRTETSTNPPETCEPSTAEPVADVLIRNDSETRVTADVTIERLSDDGEAVVEEGERSLPSGESSELFEVFPDDATYRFTVTLGNGTSRSTEIETGPNRRSVVSIRIEEPDTIDIGKMNVHPPATPTPCS